MIREINIDEHPESGFGILTPINSIERIFNLICLKLPILSVILIFMIAFFIVVDVVGRLFFNMPWRGITELEILFMSAIGFSALPFPLIERQSIQIEMCYEKFSDKMKRFFYLLSCFICCAMSIVLIYCATKAALEWERHTIVLNIPEWPFILFTAFSFVLSAIAFLFQIIHVAKSMFKKKEYVLIILALLSLAGLIALPFIYKMIGIRLSGVIIGGLGFSLLMFLLFVRIPLGFAMCSVGVLGLLAIMRRPEIAFNSIGAIPFLETATFIMIAFPMFMLMGEMVCLSGLSDDLFDATKKWLGRLPGGLAIASVGGCAGFGAVCGDSLPTVITMSTVAMPVMEENKYDLGLSAGALAAGGTLGILIPPSMGFIIYSMITEESVGLLFIAGIIPGIILTSIFMLIIAFQVIKNPSLAPKSSTYNMGEKLISLVKLIPIVILFVVVVVGILKGLFTPAEGGAIGSVLSLIYAVFRGISWENFKKTMLRTTLLFGKIFALFVGLYIFNTFLSASRLPNLLADSIAALEMNRYMVLTAIIILYIILGCVMNIIPMMMLTLPTIYPTITALGFDGIWFGVVCVIVMEMGMITPPVGMNVFTMASLYPHIPMSTIFRGVMPFFLGMLLCVILVIMFPQLTSVFL